MAELAYAIDLGSIEGYLMRVRAPLAPLCHHGGNGRLPRLKILCVKARVSSNLTGGTLNNI